MNATAAIKENLNHRNKNELFFASQVYKDDFAGKCSEEAYYKALERMVKDQQLSKAGKGIYYIPNVSKFGPVPLSEKKIVEAFTEQNAGMEIGYTLYRNMELTTQVSKTIELYSQRISSTTRRIGNVLIKRVDLVFSEEIKSLVAAMEVYQHFYDIQDLNLVSFIKLTQNFSHSFDQEAFDRIIRAIKYKKSTIAFAESILNFYSVPNELHQYLSPVSTYRHPKMEVLYETAHI